MGTGERNWPGSLRPFPSPPASPCPSRGQFRTQSLVPGRAGICPQQPDSSPAPPLLPLQAARGAFLPQTQSEQGLPAPQACPPPSWRHWGIPACPAGEQFLSVLTPQTGSNSVKEIRGQRGRSRTSKPFRPVGFNIKPPGASDTVLISATTREKLGLERHSSPCVKNRV